MHHADDVQLTIEGRNAFDEAMQLTTGDLLHAERIETIQVNIGLSCNLACRHCHVESGPNRTEQMEWETMQLVLDAARRAGSGVIDITGGAPEMNPHFRTFVGQARDAGLDVIVRTNLTIMLQKGYEDLPQFFREQRVHLVASLPCYLPTNVDRQRGAHVYDDSIEVIRRLNEAGYGMEPELSLDLVYNPLGPTLPPSQDALEAEYRRELLERWGIRFNRLFTITNMPIGRFQHDLDRSGDAEQYWRLLADSFNPQSVPGLMCRHQVHVSYDGTMHDCDFNYALGMGTNGGSPTHIRDFDSAALSRRRIATGRHCLGCTAGAGSSCGGAIVDHE